MHDAHVAFLDVYDAYSRMPQKLTINNTFLRALHQNYYYHFSPDVGFDGYSAHNSENSPLPGENSGQAPVYKRTRNPTTLTEPIY